MYYFSLVLLLFAAVNIQTLNHIYLRYGSYFKNIISPHQDSKMVSAEMNDLAAELLKDKVNCYLGWSSEGVIALLSRKRFCTKYTYAAHIAQNEEQNFLAAIKQDPPTEVVFNSPQWSMTVEDVSMRNRLPMINQYIEEGYPTKRIGNNYTIVRR